MIKTEISDELLNQPKKKNLFGISSKIFNSHSFLKSEENIEKFEDKNFNLNEKLYQKPKFIAKKLKLLSLEDNKKSISQKKISFKNQEFNRQQSKNSETEESDVEIDDNNNIFKEKSKIDNRYKEFNVGPLFSNKGEVIRYSILGKADKFKYTKKIDFSSPTKIRKKITNLTIVNELKRKRTDGGGLSPRKISIYENNEIYAKKNVKFLNRKEVVKSFNFIIFL